MSLSRHRVAAVSLAAVFIGLAAGCHRPEGAIMSYTGATQTLYSTERSPKTFRLVDTRTEEVVFELDIPVGKQFTYDFIEEGGDDPVYRPSLMRYQLFPLGSTYGKLRSGVTVPNAASRRIDWFVREGGEYRAEAPEYRMRTDRLADRPAWWSPEGGPMPEDRKTTMYDQ